MGSHGSGSQDESRRTPLRKRVTCEVGVDGRVYKGVATELAPHEIFVQLSGSSLPRRGAEVVIRLRDDAIGGDGLELTAVVSRQEHGDVGDQGLTRGVMARIVEAPAEYHRLFGGGQLEDTTEVEILVEVASGGTDFPARRTVPDPLGPPADRIAEDDEPVPVEARDDRPALRESPSRDDDLPTSRAGERDQSELPMPRTEPDEPVSSREEAAEGAKEITDVTGAFPAPVDPARTPRAANAIVVYDGDKLQDVYDLLEAIGAHPERARLSGPTRFRGWDVPPKILVADAQDAVSIDWPQDLIADGVVRIAVASSASAVLGKLMRAQGFHYLIRRPLHREALEVLLRHALHRGAERRRQPRAPVGIDARLWTGRWHWPSPCTLLELSPVGCRVATRADVPLLSPVTLRVSRRASGTRPIALRSRVVRRRYDEASASGRWLCVFSRCRPSSKVASTPCWDVPRSARRRPFETARRPVCSAASATGSRPASPSPSRCSSSRPSRRSRRPSRVEGPRSAGIFGGGRWIGRSSLWTQPAIASRRCCGGAICRRSACAWIPIPSSRPDVGCWSRSSTG